MPTILLSGVYRSAMKMDPSLPRQSLRTEATLSTLLCQVKVVLLWFQGAEKPLSGRVCDLTAGREQLLGRHASLENSR